VCILVIIEHFLNPNPAESGVGILSDEHVRFLPTGTTFLPVSRTPVSPKTKKQASHDAKEIPDCDEEQSMTFFSRSPTFADIRKW
jgi:hypothetical protein